MDENGAHACCTALPGGNLVSHDTRMKDYPVSVCVYKLRVLNMLGVTLVMRQTPLRYIQGERSVTIARHSIVIGGMRSKNTGADDLHFRFTTQSRSKNRSNAVLIKKK